MENKDLRFLVGGDDKYVLNSIGVCLDDFRPECQIKYGTNEKEVVGLISEINPNMIILNHDLGPSTDGPVIKVLDDHFNHSMDGFVLIKKIREIKSDVPILLLSVYSLEYLMGTNKLDDRTSFLQKPADVDALKAVVNKYLPSASD